MKFEVAILANQLREAFTCIAAGARESGRALGGSGRRAVILVPQAPGDGFAAREDILRLCADEVMARR